MGNCFGVQHDSTNNTSNSADDDDTSSTRSSQIETIRKLVLDDAPTGPFRCLLGAALKVELLDRLGRQAESISESYETLEGQGSLEVFLSNVAYLSEGYDEHSVYTNAEGARNSVNRRPIISTQHVMRALAMFNNENVATLYIKMNGKAMSISQHRTVVAENVAGDDVTSLQVTM